MRFLLLWLWAAAAAFAVDLVVDGRSSYRICLPANAIPAEKRAAAELQRFLEEMSGARLPIVTDDSSPTGKLILLGDNALLRRASVKVPFAELGADGAVIAASGANLIVAGGRPRGTLYGVYALLDGLGCRWYTREVSRIPKRRTIRLSGLPQTHKPAFEYREPFFTEAWDKDWAARNRTNGHHQSLDESTGGRLRYHPFVHSFYELLPPQKYFQDHPEYYSLIDGKRRWERGQLCLTNPDVKRLAVEQVRAWIAEHPDATLLSVSQNDWEGWCECDACRRVEEEEGGEHSGPLLRFVNAVAEEVERTHPDKLIDTLAYWYTERPPAKVRPRPNVRIRLCPIGVCEAHPYEQCPRSAYFVKNLRAWSKITNQLYIWHYNTNFSHYLLPFPDFDEFAADIPMYRRMGVVGLFMQGAYPPNGGGENSELRAWVISRLLWDPATKVNAAVEEFLGEVYGPAAKPMRAYFDLLHNEVRRSPGGKGTHIWIFNLPVYSAEFLPRAEALFQEAERVAGDDAVRARVRKARLPIEYVRLLEARRYEIRDGVYTPLNPGVLRDRFQTLLANVRSFGITSIHEGRDLAVDEQDYAALKPFSVESRENGRYRVDVAAELSGRVIRLLDKAASRSLLRATDPGEHRYPDVGGATVTVHADYQARPWPVVWRRDPGGGADEIRLTGEVSNGLRVRQTLRLTADGLAMTALVENPGADPVEAVVRIGAELDPGDVDRAAVTFRQRDGVRVVRPLIRPEQEPTGNATFSAATLPDGEWMVENPGWTRPVVVGFDASEVSRAGLAYSAKGSARVTLSAWSGVGRLERDKKVGVSVRVGSRE